MFPRTNTPCSPISNLKKKEYIKQKTEFIKNTCTDDNSKCIVCKYNARPKSIYCSDDCIRKHAQEALALGSQPRTKNFEQIMNVENKQVKEKNLFEEVLRLADRNPKAEKVILQSK